MKQIGTRLSNEIFERLQKDAEKSGTNISDLLRQIVGEHYEKAASADHHAKTLAAIEEARLGNLASFTELWSSLSKAHAIEKDFRNQVRKALNITAPQSPTQPAATAAAQPQQQTKN